MNTHTPRSTDALPRQGEDRPCLRHTKRRPSNDRKRPLRRHLEVNARLEKLADV